MEDILKKLEDIDDNEQLETLHRESYQTLKKKYNLHDPTEIHFLPKTVGGDNVSKYVPKEKCTAEKCVLECPTDWKSLHKWK